MVRQLRLESDGSERNASEPPELTAIVNRIRELTKASGAAVGLTSNRPGEVECCARSGSTAPEIGATVIAEDGLTALCIRSGKQLRCDNAEADPRVRNTAMFDLGVRSLVLTPIQQKTCICGVLAVFANVPYGFSTTHQAQLSAAAAEIAETLWKSQITEEKPLDSLRMLSAPSVATAKAAADLQPTEQPLPASIPSLVRFPTFEGVAQARKKWQPRNVLLIAAVALLTIAFAIFAALKSRTSISYSDKEVEQEGGIASPAPETKANITDETRADIASQTPANQAVLRIEPPAPAPRHGISFALNVVVSHGRDILAVPMQINYDPRVLRFVEVSLGSFFSKNGRTPIFAHRDDPASGILKINAQLPPGASPVSGNGTVCRLVFVALEKGAGAISVAATARNSHDELVNVIGSRVAVSVN